MGADIVAGAGAAGAATGGITDRVDHGVREGRRVVGRDEPAGRGVVDDDRGAAAIDGDHGELAGHRLDQDLAELLVDGGVDEQVAGAEKVGQVGVGVPAGKEDAGTAKPLDRLDRVLPLPLPGVPAEQDQGGRLVESVAELKARGEIPEEVVVQTGGGGGWAPGTKNR